MLFCKHNSAFAKPSPAERENYVLTPLSYSDLALSDNDLKLRTAAELANKQSVWAIISIKKNVK